MMAEAERLLGAEGCPKINLMVRSSNTEVLAFTGGLASSRTRS
jgi:ribosomal protein S18 acetylase RimI-like enzyme